MMDKMDILLEIDKINGKYQVILYLKVFLLLINFGDYIKIREQVRIRIQERKRILWHIF